MTINDHKEYCHLCDKLLSPGKARLTWMSGTKLTGNRFAWHCQPHHNAIIKGRVSRRKRHAAAKRARAEGGSPTFGPRSVEAFNL